MEMSISQFTGGLSIGLFAWLLAYSSCAVWGFFRGLFTYNHRAF